MIGIIAEDDSDVESIKIFIQRIKNNPKISVKKFVGHGCGKLSRKCNSWARLLHESGCSVLILMHDLDRNKQDVLNKKLEQSLAPCPIKNYIISIPVQELEAWLLSDSDVIKRVFGIKKNIKLPNNPESIDSPKEYIGRVVDRESDYTKYYLNTKHNQMISKEISISKIYSKCPSFKPFQDFVKVRI